MLKVALTSVNKTPALLGCTKESLLQSVMMAAELGLEPGGMLGEGYLIPYGKICQFIPGYRGLISLARRSGQIISLEAHIVHERDKFTYELGLESKLVHIPNIDEEDLGPVKFVYAVAKLSGGGVQFEVMSKAQVDSIRRRSKSGSSGPWVSDYEEMARKTVVRRLFKYLPVSVELVKALEIQAAAESGEFEQAEITIEVESDAVPDPEQKGVSTLKDLMTGGK
jgi:recombination protein RecT